VRAVELVRSAAAWYLRRRGIVRFAIFAAIFLAPALVYAIQQMPSPEEVEASAVQVQDGGPLPECSLHELLSGRQVYYVGELEYMKVWRVNETACVYRYPGGYGLLLVAGLDPEPVFVVTLNASGTVEAGGREYRYSRVTLVLPAEPSPTVPLTYRLCELVGDASDPYTAYTRQQLPSSYSTTCP